jgi:hypothetical protein
LTPLITNSHGLNLMAVSGQTPVAAHTRLAGLGDSNLWEMVTPTAGNPARMPPGRGTLIGNKY